MTAPTVTWLGQSGWAIRAATGDALLVDPYLSDSVEAAGGPRRVAPIALDPASAVVQAIVITHEHLDHLDPDTCGPLHAANAAAIFAGPPSVCHKLAEWGIPPECIRSLAFGESVEIGAFRLHAGFARHEPPGDVSADAISVVIECDGLRLFHSGDTEYDARLRDALEFGPVSIGLYVINGTGGNMNAREAALLATAMAPQLAVPMHWGMWDDSGYEMGGVSHHGEASLDPDVFVRTCAALSGPPVAVPRLGEPLLADDQSRAQTLVSS